MTSSSNEAPDGPSMFTRSSLRQGARIPIRAEPSHRSDPELAEVPAGDLRRCDPEPRVTAVVEHAVARAALVLCVEQRLGRSERVVRLSGARHLAGRLHLAVDLDAAQLVVLLARLHQERNTRIALEVGPALAAGDG